MQLRTIADIRHSAMKGETVLLSQADEIHENFYDMFNQRFMCVTRLKQRSQGEDDEVKLTSGDNERELRVERLFYTNVAMGARIKPSRVDPAFQCIVVIKQSEVANTPAPFLNRFEKYTLSHQIMLEDLLQGYPSRLRNLLGNAMGKVCHLEVVFMIMS